MNFQEGKFGKMGVVGGGGGGSVGGRTYYSEDKLVCGDLFTSVLKLSYMSHHVFFLSLCNQFINNHTNNYSNNIQPGGKPKNNKLESDQTYQGRKVVPNIHHLYNVVDDKKAYVYYDRLLSDVSSATTSEGSGGVKEEEMVDRMLSQFPEFGTNRPTPFTILDTEEDAASNSNKKENKLSSQLESKTMHETDTLLSPRIFTDDASDIIGRFFFGPPPPGSSAGTTAQGSVGNKGAGKGIVHSASFGSTSTMSTMTSAKGRTTRNQQGGEEENLFVHDDNNAVLDHDENMQVTGWDQDEIDLWNTHYDIDAKVETKEEVPAEEKVEEDWVSHRRRLLELQKKRWNWDELGPGVSLTAEVSKTVDEGTYGASFPSMDIIEAQRILKATPPAQQHSHEGPANNYVQDGDQSKRKGGGAVIVDDGKQHWMPDSLCKQCYACEAPFTLLRRKHHCRLCGMIFW